MASDAGLVSYAQNREDLYLWALLGHRGLGVYVDVGCNDERTHSVTRLFYERGWSGVNIDANRAFAEQYQRRTRDRFIACGVGAAPGSATFRVYAVHGHSTFDDDLKSAHAAAGLDHMDTEVVIRTLDDILQEVGISRIDFLKIDVEGLEPSVLRGLDLTRVRPSVIVLEASRTDECEAILTPARYHREFFDGLNLYYADDDADDVNILNYAGTVLASGYRTDLERCQQEALDTLRRPEPDLEVFQRRVDERTGAGPPSAASRSFRRGILDGLASLRGNRR